MSTTIDVYPASDYLPAVGEIRARTQELFQRLLDKYRIESTVEVKAFSPNDGSEPIRYVDDHLRWYPGLGLGFGYWINGEWDSSSWPSCLGRDDDDVIVEEDLMDDEDPHRPPPELLGQWWIIEKLVDAVPPDQLAKILRSDHYWSDYRNMGGPGVASTGYGLTAAALAEFTDGVLASFDCAFGDQHNGETADRFLAWWGDQQIGFYGTERFLQARR